MSSQGSGEASAQHFDVPDAVMGAPHVLHQSSTQGSMFGNGMPHTLSPGPQGYPQQGPHYSGGHSQFAGMGSSGANVNYGGPVYTGGNGPFTPSPMAHQQHMYPDSFDMGSRRRRRMHDNVETEERLDSLENSGRAAQEEVASLKAKVAEQAAAIGRLEEQFKVLSSVEQEGNSAGNRAGEKLDGRIGVSIQNCSYVIEGLTSGTVTGISEASDEEPLRS